MFGKTYSGAGGLKLLHTCAMNKNLLAWVGFICYFFWQASFQI